MKGKNFLEKLKKTFHLNHNHKINPLALFSFFLPVISFAQAPIVDGVVVYGLETEILVEFDGQKKTFKTDSLSLGEALKRENIALAEKDAVFPNQETLLKGESLSAKVKRAVPYVVEEGYVKKTIFSGYENPTEILKQNNIEIHPEDKITVDLISNFFEDFSLGQKIVIKRAPSVSILVDNGESKVRTWKGTVGEALADSKILLSPNDKVGPSKESYVFNGMVITITRVAESEVKETETIEFGEKVIEDTNAFIGKDFVKVAGQNGTKENTFKIISENGVMVSKTLIDSAVVSEPTTQVRVKGTKPYNATTLWPTIVAASEQFGVSPSAMHKVMICESGGNPYAGSFYKGLFQYHPDTWAGASSAYPGATYAGASIFDPTAQIYVTAWKVSRSGWGAWGCKP